MSNHGVRSTPAARALAYLFVFGGATALLDILLSPAGRALEASIRVDVVRLSLLDLVAAAIVLVLPWARWSPRLTLIPAVLALPLHAAFAAVGFMSSPVSVAFLVVGFLWVGAFHPWRWAVASSAPAAASYAVPLAMLDADPGEIGDLVVIVPVLLLVAFAVSRAVARQRLEQERSERDALTDALTGLANRRAIDAALVRLRPDDVVVLLDLDHFKLVNDRHGHGRGDEVLCEAAEHLRGLARAGDVVGRYGGEEFVLVLHQAGAGAGAVVDRLVNGWRDRNPATTFSAGFARHEAGRSPHDTVEAADRALYLAKQQGRDRAVASQR